MGPTTLHVFLVLPAEHPLYYITVLYYALQSDLYYSWNSIIRGTLLFVELDYPRFLRPKFSTPKYRG